MIAADDEPRVERPHAIDDRIGLGAIPDDVAQHEMIVHVSRRVEDGLESVEISVNVGEDEVPHGRAAP